jgi:hypothetical protein
MFTFEATLMSTILYARVAAETGLTRQTVCPNNTITNPSALCAPKLGSQKKANQKQT